MGRQEKGEREREGGAQQEYITGAQLMFLKEWCLFTCMWALIWSPNFSTLADIKGVQRQVCNNEN